MVRLTPVLQYLTHACSISAHGSISQTSPIKSKIKSNVSLALNCQTAIVKCKSRPIEKTIEVCGVVKQQSITVSRQLYKVYGSHWPNLRQNIVSKYSGFLQVFCSKIPSLFPDFSSHGITISLTLSKQ